jgi:hypothetical protein
MSLEHLPRYYEEMCGYLTKYQTEKRKAWRAAMRDKRSLTRPNLDDRLGFGYKGDKFSPNPEVVVVIAGAFEGMVARYDGAARQSPITGTDPVGRREIRVRVTNSMPYTYRPGEWTDGAILWFDVEDLDWYDRIVEEETLFSVADGIDIATHLELMHLYTMHELMEYNKYMLDRSMPVKTIYDNFLGMIEKYQALEDTRDSEPWLWRQAHHMLAWRPECLGEHELKNNVVGEMTSEFKQKVYEALDAKRIYEDDAAFRRQTHEYRSAATRAAFALQQALAEMDKYERASSVRLMVPSHPNGDYFNRALTFSTRQTLEDLIGGLQQVTESCTGVIDEMVVAGEKAWSLTECGGCGVELGPVQCRDCARNYDEPDPRGPETEEEQEQRFKRPRYDP